MKQKTTETLDRLYLEWSQYTQARTHREIFAVKDAREIEELLKSDAPDINKARSLAARITALCD